MNKFIFLKQKAIYLILGIAMLLTVFCMIRIVMPNQQYHYSGEAAFEVGKAQSNYVIYDQIVLPPGVYEVELEYQSDTSLVNLCTVKDGTVFNGGLLTNGECLYKNLHKTSFRFWLLEGTESLQVQINYDGDGSLVTGNLVINETNALWTILLTIIWSITLPAIAVPAFRRYDNMVGVSQDKKTVIFGLGVIVLIASLPYLYGGGTGGADWGYHLQRIEGVKDGILSGQFPLRLEPEWLFGHGYANGVFYCNTLLYFPAILRLLGFTVTASYNLYCIALNVATACIAYYCFMKMFRSRFTGLLCSALYTLSVFRTYKLIITGAVGEGSAVTFMPLVLYGLYRAFSEDVKDRSYKTVWIPIAVGYAGLMQTHVLSCEITAFLTIIVCVVFVKKIFVKETFCELAKGALSAVAMSAWYLVPFLDYYINEDMHIRHVSARTIQDRGLYVAQLFFNWWRMGDNAVSGDLGMVHSHAMGIGLILGIGFMVFFILWFSGKWKQENDRIVSLGKTASIMGGMLMLMSLNIFPWDRIRRMNGVTASLVSSIQFPNRFLGWGSAFLVAVWGCLLWYFGKKDKKWYYYISIICIIAGLATSNIYLLDYVGHDTQYTYLYNEEAMGTGYISGAEYVVEGTQAELLDYADPSASDGIEIVRFDKEYLHMWVTCINAGSEEGYLELPLMHYTGYRAYVTGTGEELPTMKGTNNIVRVLIPAEFEGEVEVKFVSPIHWRISEAATYAWWILIGILCVRHMRNKQKRRESLEYV